MRRVTRKSIATDDGSVAIVVLATAIAWAIVMIGAVGPVVRHLADRQQAQAAADAAALSAVLDGCAAAGELAARNEATMASCTRHRVAGGGGFEAVVTVTIGDQTAQARASNGP